MHQYKVLKMKWIVFLVIYIVLILFNKNSYSASINMGINKSSAYVGDSFTVTISGINGKLTISGTPNISLSPSGTVFVEGTLHITGKANAEGKGTITLTPIDVTTTDADPVEIKTSVSRSITITQKPAPSSTPQTNHQNKNHSSNKNTSNKTGAKSNNNPSQEKNAKQQEEVIIEEEAKPQFGLYGMTVKGITENGEEELKFTPEFSINVYEYNMEVENNIVDLKIDAYADPYGEFVKIEKPESLKVGENEILIKMENAENHLTYKLKVIRKEAPVSEISESHNAERVDANMQVNPKTITLPIWLFLLIIVVIIMVEAIILKWDRIINFRNRKKHNLQ